MLSSQIINESEWNMCTHCISEVFITRSLGTLDRCQRLSLTVFAYLWQRDQRELLDEMIQAGMNSILIKVAGIGLTVDHLGKTLSEMKTTLYTLVRTI